MNIRFRCGQLVATPAALEALRVAGQSESAFLRRHVSGDWGDALEAEDLRANEQALCDGDRLFSAYWLSTGEKLWIITEWDRSSTTILLPGDY